jgi:two-component system cell cycle sensor histidine kinase/response regulator CckA
MAAAGEGKDDGVGDALREAEQRYRLLFERSPVGTFLYDRNLICSEANAAMARILHAPSADALRGFDLRGIKDRSLVPTLERVFDGESGTYEGPYETTLGGEMVRIAVCSYPVKDGHGAIVGGMAIVEDVGDRLRAESALRASEQRMLLHVHQNPLGVIVWNNDGRVAEWNQAATRIFGYPADEAMGRKAHELIIPPHAQKSAAEWWDELRSRTAGERMMVENVDKNGRVIQCNWYNTALVDADGCTIGVASMVEDVTERRNADTALRKSEMRFRSLIEHAPDAICVLRARRFVYVNPAFAKYLGHASAEELIGMQVDQVVHPEERASVHGRRTAALEHSVLTPQEYRLFRKDGELVTCEIVSMPVDYDGEPAVLAMARDLSDRKLMQARLLQSDRMASVGTLAAGVAHEINNPLAYVKANLDVLASRRIPQLAVLLRALEEERIEQFSNGEPDDSSYELSERLSQIAAMVDLAREGAERVRSIVRDLKTFSRADEESTTPVDVSRVLDASVNMAWNEIRHRARLVKDYGEVPPVEANESRLGQVFLNLLVNAAQAIPEGRASEYEIRVRTYTDANERVVVAVSDTGSGIPQDALYRIFDPFFTTKAVGVGTGLGLWICQGIVTALGGEIAVDSVQGKGTTVTVSIPSTFTPDHLRAPHDSEMAPSTRRGRILIVDDEPALGPSLAIALSDEHDVVSARSGREALELLAKDDRFDLILCDLMMPDVTGMEVYEKLKVDRQELADRMIFVTGGSFTRRSSEFLETIAQRMLEKPFDVQRVRELLRSRIG